MMKENTDSFLIISIDVEADMPNWEIEEITTIRNFEGIPRLQDLFDKYSVRPTYLLDYPYATNEEATKYFNSIKDKCEIGAHMHTWDTPPVTEEEAKTLDYPSNLAYDRQFEKTKSVTDALTKAFGEAPTSYRAGKFGFNIDTKNILERLGYLVDTSVTPMVSWESQNGPSFLNYKVDPFWFGNPKSSLFEIPVTIGLTKNIGHLLERAYLKIPRFTKLRGLLSKDYLSLIDFVWLYPVLFSDEEMISLVNTLIKRPINVFNVFFHSSELKAGESIYTKSDADVDQYLKRMDRFFDYTINKKGMKSVTLSEYREIYNG